MWDTTTPNGSGPNQQPSFAPFSWRGQAEGDCPIAGGKCLRIISLPARTLEMGGDRRSWAFADHLQLFTDSWKGHPPIFIFTTLQII
jgi:hypothetical protein